MSRMRVLIADDEASIRYVLRETLEDEGCEVSEVEDGDAAFEELSSGRYDLAFLDIRMPGQTGLELLERLTAQRSETGVVIITAQNTFENAVEAMKRGALDYLVKPFGIGEVQALIAKANRSRALTEEVSALRREVGARTASGDRMVGKSPALLEIFKTVGRIAARDVSVLITGESGTGKELVARAIHAASARAEHPFVPVNTAAIPRELLESELFGHERGAFTGAVEARDGRFREADGGTLFLDEIGDMPPDLQAKVLRALQSGEVTPVGARNPVHVDVRILAATHRDLDAAVADGSFREDLLYRLRVVPIEIPPLRERQDDIPVLAEHFVRRYSEELSLEAHYLADSAMEALVQHPWPGNVRELENSIKRALVLANREILTSDDFGFLVAGPADGDTAALEDTVHRETLAALEKGGDDVYHQLIERVERPLIEAALAETEGNQIRAAARLGINRNTLRKKIASLGIDLPGRE